MATDKQWRAAVQAVLDIHAPHRIYNECGHNHSDEDGEAFDVLDVDDVGMVCEAGYLYSVCSECCTDQDGDQTERCADTHKHDREDNAYCRTVWAMVGALGLPGSFAGEFFPGEDQ
jgi:hypothetical protein